MAFRKRDPFGDFTHLERDARLCQTGIEQEGILPGGLNVKRRAAEMHKELTKNGDVLSDPSESFDWVSLFALAVNEENAAGGRVVTAPQSMALQQGSSLLFYIIMRNSLRIPQKKDHHIFPNSRSHRDPL